MRIAYVCLQPRGGGGASDTHVNGIVEALKARGHRVDIIESRQINGGLTARFLTAVKIQFRARTILRDSDVIWLRMHPIGLVSACLSRNSRLAIEVNGVLNDFYAAHPGLRRVGGILRLALDYQLRRADYIFPVTNGLAVQLAERLPDSHIFVVPNAVDPQLFSPGLPRPHDAPTKYVIFFGALAAWQGIDIALAAARLESWPDDLVLMIIGDGPERGSVEAAEQEMPGRIRFLGPVPPQAVPSYVANAKASVIPKRYHDPRAGQSPLKLYESLAAGVPVIATRLSGVTDLPEFTGLLHVIEPVPASLVNALTTILADEASSIERGLAGRQAILREHTWGHRAAAVMHILSADENERDSNQCN